MRTQVHEYSRADSNVPPEFRQKNYNIQIGHFFIGQKIGSGAFAVVHKAIQKFTNVEIAVKIIETKDLSRRNLRRMMQEFEVHKKINHPNIVRIYEVVKSGSKYYVFMELVEGQQLFKTLLRSGPLSQVNAVKVFHQICVAVKYLHENGIVHRDIKTQNIIVDSQFNAKLIDFGLVIEFKTYQPSFLETFCGSPSYLSPEILSKKKYNGVKVDIWCLGITLYTMLEAKLPFDQEDDNIDQINKKISNFKWEQPNFSSEAAVEIYDKIFIHQKNRIGINELLRCKLFQNWGYIPGEQNRKKININEVRAAQNIKKISKYLKSSQKQIRRQIFTQELTPAFCLFQILTKQDSYKKEILKFREKARSLLQRRKAIKSEQRESFQRSSIEKVTPLQMHLHSIKTPTHSRKYIALNTQVFQQKQIMQKLQSLDSRNSRCRRFIAFQPIHQIMNKSKMDQQIRRKKNFYKFRKIID